MFVVVLFLCLVSLYILNGQNNTNGTPLSHSTTTLPKQTNNTRTQQQQQQQHFILRIDTVIPHELNEDHHSTTTMDDQDTINQKKRDRDDRQDSSFTDLPVDKRDKNNKKNKKMTSASIRSDVASTTAFESSGSSVAAAAAESTESPLTSTGHPRGVMTSPSSCTPSTRTGRTGYQPPIPATNQANGWKEKLGLSPPRDTTSSVDDIERKMKEFGLQQYVLPTGSSPENVTEDQKIAYFLFAAFPQEIDDCINTIKEIISDDDAKKRMMNILQKKSYVADQTKGKIESWREFMKVIIRYGAVNDAVTIFDGKNIPAVLQKQSSKNCYQHATCGTLGYKIAHMKGDNEFIVHVVDTPKAVRHHYTLGQLKKRVLGNKGGSSQLLLKTLISSKASGLKLVSVDSSQLGMLHMSSHFKKFGPALVSRFMTDDIFKKKDKTTPPATRPEDDGVVYIDRFDRHGDIDRHTFAPVGEWTASDHESLNKMEASNRTHQAKKVEMWPTTNDDVLPTVSKSFSGSPGKDNDRADGGLGPETETEKLAEDVVDDGDVEGAGGLHAMIAVGSRVDKDSNNKTFVLILNTHKKLPAFEASISYLEHHLQHNGKLVFLEGKLAESSTLPMIDKSLCVEHADDDDDLPEDIEEEEEDDDEEPYDSDDLEGG